MLSYHSCLATARHSKSKVKSQKSKVLVSPSAINYFKLIMREAHTLFLIFEFWFLIFRAEQ